MADNGSEMSIEVLIVKSGDAYVVRMLCGGEMRMEYGPIETLPTARIIQQNIAAGARTAIDACRDRLNVPIVVKAP